MNQVQVTEHNGQRVLTTAQLAESYGTDSDRISKNFHENKGRYKEGKHYFKLEGESLLHFRNSEPQISISNKTRSLMLWTEKGAWMHAKSLNTDEAWDAYEMLVDDYYRVKAIQSAPQTQLEILQGAINQMVDQERRLNDHDTRLLAVEQDQKSMRDVVALSSTNWRKDSSNLIARIARAMGGVENIKPLYEEIYQLVDDRLAVKLATRLTNKRRRMADEGVCKSKRDRLNYLDVIADDKKLIEGYVAIVKEMAIKYGISSE